MARSTILIAVAALAACGGTDSDEPMIGPCGTPVNGCAEADFVDLTGPIAFGGGNGLRYVPQCARVSADTDITFSGNFSDHPLVQTCGPIAGIPSKGSGGSTTFTFQIATPGTYGYHCSFHFGSGMEGAIEVVP